MEDNDDVEEVLEKLGVYLRGQRNPLLDRREFFLRDQLKNLNESIDEYVATLALLDDLGDHDYSQLSCPGCLRPCQHGASYRYGRTRHRLIYIYFFFFYSTQTPFATGRIVGLSGGGARYTRPT